MSENITAVTESIGTVSTSAVTADILMTALISVALGILITLFYGFMNRKRGFSVEFAVTIIATCSVIGLIIAVIGTNIASAFSLAGIMSIVRFRSLQQKTSDIAFLFVAMATGLTTGLGLILHARFRHSHRNLPQPLLVRCRNDLPRDETSQDLRSRINELFRAV